MNKIFKRFVSLFLGFSLMISCTPEELTPESADVAPEDLVEGIAFKIEHDAENPNIIYLTSLVDSKYTPLWTHPQGRSQESTVALKIAFAGNYEVRFGVMTRGGAVYGAPVTFTVDDMYAEFISDPLWALLAGGAGEEKTWYLDLDADAVSRYFAGPLYFYGVDDSWLTVTEGQTVEGDSWNWCPDYPGNSWLFAAADFGAMTFNLKGGANVTVNHLTLPGRGTEHGNYTIDVENHTLKMVDAAPLHDTGRDGVVLDWGDIKIMSLTEDAMQLGVLRDAVLSGEGACLLVYNFISRDYKDNWTPGETTEPEIVLPDGWQDDISQFVTSSIKWALSPATPFNWANSAGELLNSWSAATDYPDWAGFGAADADAYANFSLTLNSDDHSAVYVAPDGAEQTGSYELSETGYYTFTGFTPNVSIGSWMELRTTPDDNRWRVVRIEKGASGLVTGMWVGIPNPDNAAEYIVWKLEPQTGGSADADAAVREMLCAHTWKIDLEGTKFGGPLTYAPPASFPSLAGDWTPGLSENDWVMINGDHGAMKFNEDGTVNVVQKTVADGTFTGEETRAGIWTYNGATLKLLVSIPILHADNFTGNVVNWGDSRIASAGADFLRLVVVRDPVLSGEDEYLYVFNYIPAE
jgi:hypothetical protein